MHAVITDFRRSLGKDVFSFFVHGATSNARKCKNGVRPFKKASTSKQQLNSYFVYDIGRFYTRHSRVRIIRPEG